MVEEAVDLPGDQDLRDFAAYWRGRCDKLVNFSESFEGAALAHKNRPIFWWPHEARHRHMDIPYLQLAADVAGVPYVAGAGGMPQKFYAGLDDEAAALEWKRKHVPEGDALVVAAAMSRSGVMKVWPHAFEFVGRLALENDHVQIACVGDFMGGEYFEHERIHAIGTSMPVGAAFALAQHAHLVIGQETGILNAVAMEPMPKLVLLSHSSRRNLTNDWVNTHALAADGEFGNGRVACWPCHRLHGDWTGCMQDAETKQAACQSAIKPGVALQFVRSALNLPAPKLMQQGNELFAVGADDTVPEMTN